VLREILKELDDKITAEDLDMMIEEIDSDGSGTVDFDGKHTSYCSTTRATYFMPFSTNSQNSWR
jgi:Ca2+-binding EF-hand superfamily protein